MSQNQYGLSRNIPLPIKRLIRQNSKFGCVMCRAAVCEYEHIEPEFKDAHEHDPDRICLLCPTHHELVTKGRIPKVEIANAYEAIRNSPNPESPVDDEFFRLYTKNPIIQLGATEFEKFESIINVNGENILSYEVLQEFPYSCVNGLFKDAKGENLFSISDNEWAGSTEIWDVESVGQRMVIRQADGRIVFSAVKNPVQGRLVIEKLDMLYPPFHICVDDENFSVGHYTENGENAVYVHLYGGSFLAGSCALYLDSTHINEPVFGGVAVRGSTVYIEGTGICLGYEAKRCLLLNATAENKNQPIEDIKFGANALLQ